MDKFKYLKLGDLIEEKTSGVFSGWTDGEPYNEDGYIYMYPSDGYSAIYELSDYLKINLNEAAKILLSEKTEVFYNVNGWYEVEIKRG
ncbi:hypothetical protein [Lactobacillus mulieris]|uniref:Uncharacterized protein n=1 Tax=Lactobacillus mulieris TaxID=2508708 RepID=A0ABT4JZY9_9LACO|nr:hypothetical protein [Lactobacillus mulieris]MCZ3621370.1 hypothetical protein [Lactobacillus mulieris]MCZ3623354.1 hypothetical protein [Lactobacillus mulieris]MCZ3635377.1 hypothetical protein [Lactobacillus mulieris]MCZ3741104.1 hypothetical protein [Lactobacillus mulieris]MCZ3744823.1 hypothetical protein [Lactobacillus mulieris]